MAYKMIVCCEVPLRPSVIDRPLLYPHPGSSAHTSLTVSGMCPLARNNAPREQVRDDLPNWCTS